MALINHGFTSDEAEQLAAAAALGLLSRARLWTARLRLRRRYDERQQLACVRASWACRRLCMSSLSAARLPSARYRLANQPSQLPSRGIQNNELHSSANMADKQETQKKKGNNDKELSFSPISHPIRLEQFDYANKYIRDMQHLQMIHKLLLQHCNTLLKILTCDLQYVL